MRSFIAILVGCVVCIGVANAAVIEQVEMIGDEEYALTLTSDKKQIFLGTLVGQPHLYVLTITETMPLALSLYRQADEVSPDTLSVMIVADRFPRGVEALARLRSSDTTWVRVRDTKTRVVSEQGQVYRTELDPGTYRIEISTPTNQGRYELRFGDEQKSTWWTEVKNMRTLQRWYGTLWWQSLLSPLIYMPFGVIILLACMFWFVWLRRFFYV